MRERVHEPGPIRTCVGCGTRDRQTVMTRLQVDAAGALVAVTRAGAGRSAYVHATAECERGLVKSRLLRRSLRRDLDRAARERAAARLGADNGNEVAPPQKRP